MSSARDSIWSMVGYIFGGYVVATAVFGITGYIFISLYQFLSNLLCPRPHSDTCTCEQCYWANLPANERKLQVNSLWDSNRESNPCTEM